MSALLEEMFGSLLMIFATRVTRLRDQTKAVTALRLDMHIVLEEICRQPALMQKSNMPTPFGVSCEPR